MRSTAIYNLAACKCHAYLGLRDTRFLFRKFMPRHPASFVAT